MENLVEIQETYNEYLGKMVGGCDSLAELFRNQEITDALELLKQFIEGVNWLTTINEKLKIMGLNGDFDFNSINEQLNLINSGLEILDFTLVADIFEYELVPFFEQCSKYDLNTNL